MGSALTQFWALAQLTAREALRQPLCLLLVLTAVLCTLFTPLLVAHQLGEPAKLARDGALAFNLVFGLLLGGYVACSTLGTEIRGGTAATVLSKAVRRETFFLAKQAGVTAVILLFGLCAAAAALLGERLAPRVFQTDVLTLRLVLIMLPSALAGAGLIAFFSRRSFAACACVLLALALIAAVALCARFDRDGQRVAFGAAVDWRLIPASALVTVALVIAAAIALSLSTRLRTAPTIVILILVLFLGLVADHLLGAAATRSGLAFCLYSLLPNWQHFWMADALAGGGRVSWLYVGRTLPYAVLYSAGVLCLGLVSFRHRQF
jgi:hypothetical protein